MNEEETSARLRRATAPRFESGFADRVMARIESGAEVLPESVFADALRRRFLRTVPAALAASLALLAWSLSAADEGGRSRLDIALGLPAVSLEEAYGLSTSNLLDLQEVTP